MLRNTWGLLTSVRDERRRPVQSLKIICSAIRAATMPSGPTGARGAEHMGLRIGDDVHHEKFGEGVILDIEGSGDKAEVIVRFPDVGEKRLLLAWAPLVKVG